MFKQSLKYLAISTIILSRTLPTIASCNDEAEPHTQNKIKPEFNIVDLKNSIIPNIIEFDVEGISADGTTIVGHINRQAFFWTKENGSTIFKYEIPSSNPRKTISSLFSVNFNGTVFLAGFDLNALSVPIAKPYFLKKNVTKTNCWDKFKPDPDIYVHDLNVMQGVTAMSGDGKTLVGYDSYYENGARNAAYTYQQGVGKKILENLNKGKYGSVALGTNFDGSVAVGYSSDHKNNHNSRATVWINGAIRSLGILPPQEIKKARTHMCFTHSKAIATNHDGSVTIGYCDLGGSGGNLTGFIHTLQRGIESLGSLNKKGFDSRPKAINWYGNVIVGSSTIGKDKDTGSQQIRAFIWTPEKGMVSLTDYLKPYLPKGVILEEATGVSADGSIAIGTGLNLNRRIFWRAYLPEFKSGDIKFGTDEIANDKPSIKVYQTEAN
ncbi:MAG: hypothetical protein BGO77_07190 [Caedibacter sp. 37-49]|nr:MAG: hypothetical protein BGO77_07190 [Caedibacter sp. 37-49]